MKITNLTVHELQEKLVSGELTSYDIVKAYTDMIGEKEEEVQAFVTKLSEEALTQAKEIDVKRKNGEDVSSLAGIPIGIKDNMCTKGVRTTCSSKM